MQEHFNFNDETMEALSNDGVSMKHLFDFARKYSVGDNDAPISYVNLFYFVDEKGDFNEKPVFASKKIAQAMFEQLDIKQKIELSEYIGDLEDGEF